MKYFQNVLLAVALAAISSFPLCDVARAADAPAKAEAAPTTKTLPIELSGKDVDDMSAYLNSQPYSVVNPIVNFLAAKEAAALAAASAAPAKPEVKK